MTIRTFWSIFLKIMGIYLIIDSFSVVLQSIISILMTRTYGEASVIFAVSTILGALVSYFLILRFLVFKSGWIIDKLKLDQGFEEERFELNMHRSTVLSIAIIIIGGMLFVENIPILCRNIFTFCTDGALHSHFQDRPSLKWVIIYGLKVTAGYIIMTNYKTIVNTIERKIRNSNTNPENHSALQDE